MSDEPILAGSGNVVSVSAGEPTPVPSDVLANPLELKTQREIQQQFTVTRMDALSSTSLPSDNAALGASVLPKD